MESETEGRSFRELLTPFNAALVKYWKVVLAPCLAFAAIVGVITFRIPNYYESEALIFIQPQRIASKVVENPEKKDDMRERLEAIVQEILSRPRLRAVIDRYKIYPDLVGERGGEYAIRRFRDHIDIAPAQSPTGVQLLQTFRLAFTHFDPKTTFEVTKALSNLFIEESLIDRRSEVQGTEEFLDAELKEARRKLEQTESQVQQFVSSNFGKLPEHLDQAVARLETARAQLATNSQLIAANLQRKANLEAEVADMRRLSAVTPGGSSASSSDPHDPRQALSQLESAYTVLTSRYSEQHPDVISTRNRIQALKEQIAADGEGPSRTVRQPYINPTSPLVLNVRRQLGEVDVQLTALRKEDESLKVAINQLQKNIEQMPVKEQELLKIRRDYANVKANYERLLSAREDASLQSSMIRSQKATQFRLIEPAEMPIISAGPPRELIIGLGLLVSLGLFLFSPMILYLLRNAYQVRSELEADLGIPVLAVVPPMNTPESLSLTRRRAYSSAFASVASVIAAFVGAFWVF